MPQPRDLSYGANSNLENTGENGNDRDKMLDCPNNSPYERNPLNDVGGYQDYEGRHGDYDCHPDGFGDDYDPEMTESAVDCLLDI